MRFAVLLAFTAVLGLSSAVDTEQWGGSQNYVGSNVDVVPLRTSVASRTQDYQTITNRELWEVLKTKQQKLKTAKVTLQELIVKRHAKLGIDQPSIQVANSLLKAVDHLLTYKPKDPSILSERDLIELNSKNRIHAYKTYGEYHTSAPSGVYVRPMEEGYIPV